MLLSGPGTHRTLAGLVAMLGLGASLATADVKDVPAAVHTVVSSRLSVDEIGCGTQANGGSHAATANGPMCHEVDHVMTAESLPCALTPVTDPFGFNQCLGFTGRVSGQGILEDATFDSMATQTSPAGSGAGLAPAEDPLYTTSFSVQRTFRLGDSTLTTSDLGIGDYRPSVLQTAWVLRVVGGTGQYAGATGTLFYNAAVSLDYKTYTGGLTGTICFPGQ